MAKMFFIYQVEGLLGLYVPAIHLHDIQFVMVNYTQHFT